MIAVEVMPFQELMYKMGTASGTYASYPNSTNSFMVTTEGINHIYIRSLDHAGNSENEQDIIYKIDKSAPTSSGATQSYDMELGFNYKSSCSY